VNHPFVLPIRSAMARPMVETTSIGGFLQARAAMKLRGRTVGPALLFQGCRHPAQDHIYADEFAAFAQAGVVEL